ncbi:MAG: TVP38/TMEM64 family protein [Planctomycetes bacterium]|nr:TVP38/TMEM64 family protein [Planctomycetota bacterium]
MTETENKPEQLLPASQQHRKKITTIIILVIIILAVIAGTRFLTTKDWLIKSLEWTQELGIWGPVFVVAFYIVACVLFIPGSILTLGAGFLFKVFIGSITVSIGSTLGACAAFLVGRTVARKWIAGKVVKYEKFAAIEEAVAQQGFKIVLLTRLSPIFPFFLLNYAFGLTKISFWKYALGSWIGMMPGTIMYVYFGAGLRSLADVAAGNVEKSTAGTIFFWLGLVATIVVTVFVTRIARNALRQAVPQTTSETEHEQKL